MASGRGLRRVPKEMAALAFTSPGDCQRTSTPTSRRELQCTVFRIGARVLYGPVLRRTEPVSVWPQPRVQYGPLSGPVAGDRLLARVVICGIVIFKANGANCSHETAGGESVRLRQTNGTDWQREKSSSSAWK